MIKLRKEHEVFVYGAYDLLLETDPDVYVYTRYLDNVLAVILCNFRNKTVELDLHEVEQKDYRLVLSNFEGAPDTLTGMATLKPYETRVYLSK